MKPSRLFSSVACLLLAVTVSACGSSGDAGSDASDGPAKSTPVDVEVPVPAALKSKGSITVGIACDYPPFGYTGIDGKNAGYDADVSRTLARYAFGDESKVKFTCVTPQNRIPYLETGKIDIIASTLGYTKERDETIDYSVPYFDSGAKLLVKKASPVKGWKDVEGKAVITKQGTTSSTYLQNCYPTSQQLLLEGTSDAVTALKDDRGVAFAEDSTLLLGLTLNDDSLKVVGEDKAETPWGLGIKQGDTETKKWVDAVLEDLQAKDELWKIFTGAVDDKKAVEAFATNMPRPDQDIAYTDEDTLSDCS